MKFCKINILIIGLIFIIPSDLAARLIFHNVTNEDIAIRASCDWGDNQPKSWGAGQNDFQYWEIMYKNPIPILPGTSHPNSMRYAHTKSFNCPNSGFWNEAKHPNPTIIFGYPTRDRSGQQMVTEIKSPPPATLYDSTESDIHYWIDSSGCVFWGDANGYREPQTASEIQSCQYKWK